MLEIKPRGMAQALYSAAIGPQPHQITIRDGVTVHGRLMAAWC